MAFDPNLLEMDPPKKGFDPSLLKMDDESKPLEARYQKSKTAPAGFAAPVSPLRRSPADISSSNIDTSGFTTEPAPLNADTVQPSSPNDYHIPNAWGERDMVEPPLSEQFRMTPMGRFIMGPSSAELETGKAGSRAGLADVGGSMLHATSVPPQIANPARKLTDPLIDLIPNQTAQGMATGAREMVLGTPTAPFLAPMKLGKYVLAAFTAQQLAHLPEQHQEFLRLVREGKQKEAASLATQEVLTDLAIMTGWGIRSKGGKAEPKNYREAAEQINQEEGTKDASRRSKYAELARAVGPAAEKAVEESMPPLGAGEGGTPFKVPIPLPPSDRPANQQPIPGPPFEFPPIENPNARLAADRPIQEPYSDKHSISIQVSTTDASGVTDEAVKNSLPPELRDKVEQVRRFQGQAVPGNDAMSVPARIELVFPDRTTAQAAHDHYNKPTTGDQNASSQPSPEGVSQQALRPSVGENPPLRQSREAAGTPSPEENPPLPGGVDAQKLAGGAQGPEPLSGLRQTLADISTQPKPADYDPAAKGGSVVAKEGPLTMRRVRSVDVDGELMTFFGIDQGDKYAGYLSTRLSVDRKTLVVNWMNRQENARFYVRPIYRKLMEQFPEATKIEAERITGLHQGPITYTRSQIMGVPEYLKQFKESEVPPPRSRIGQPPPTTSQSGMILNPLSEDKPSYSIQRTASATTGPTEHHNFVIYDNNFRPKSAMVQTEPGQAPYQFTQEMKRAAGKVSVQIMDNGKRAEIHWVDLPKKLDNATQKSRVWGFLTREFPKVRDWNFYKLTTTHIDWGEGRGREVEHISEQEFFDEPSSPNKLKPAPWTSESGALSVPPALERAVQGAKLALSDKLEELRQFGKRAVTPEGWSNIYKTYAAGNDFAALMDAADNKAAIYGREAGNTLLPNDPRKSEFAPVNIERLKDREAATAIVEANNDPRQLEVMLEKVRAENVIKSNGEAARQAADVFIRAREHWGRLKPLADQARAIHDAQHEHESNNGVDTDHNEGYIRHAYDMELFMLQGPQRGITTTGRSAGSILSSFRKQRTYPTYADAIADGYKPLSWDIGKLTESRVKAGMRLVNRHEWIESLKGYSDPIDGRPVLQNMVRGEDGSMMPPQGYVGIEILPYLKVGVHPEFVPVIEALVGRSIVAKSRFGSALLKTEGGIKHFILGFDTFHIGRMMRKEAFLTGKVSYKKGVSLLDYDDATLDKLTKANEIPQEIADYAKENRPIAKLGLDNGLNVGRIQEALYSSAVQGIPLVGRLNRWTFDKLTRGAMMESFIHEYNRVRPNYPNWSEQRVARKVASDMNFYYGNLQRQGVFKNQTYRDWMRIFFLAPQWVESMAQTEVRAMVQAGQVPFDAAANKTIRVGSLAKGVGTSLMAYVAATQLINLGTRGHFTWDNPEKGHKLDAFIPGPAGGPGVFISPLSVPAEMNYDAWHNWENTPINDVRASHVARTIIENKGSPLSRAAEIALTRETPMTHERLTSIWQVAKESAWTLYPVPLGLQSFGTLVGVEHGDYPGRGFRQTLSSTGERPSVAPSAEQEMAKRARDWNQKFGRKAVGDFVPYADAPYHQVQMAIRSKNKVRIGRAIAAAEKGEGGLTADDLAKRMEKWANSPFTGSAKREDEFIATLDQPGLELYQKALQGRQETLLQFYQALIEAETQKK